MLDSLARRSLKSHSKIMVVNTVLKTAQSWEVALRGYEPVPNVDPGVGQAIKVWNFRLQVKREMPLYTKYGVAEVSVALPPDCGVLEVYLFEDKGTSRDDMPFADIRRFDSVPKLMVFLDEMAVATDLTFLGEDAADE
jgi:hypothetical protein